MVSGVGGMARDIQRYLLFPKNNSDVPLCMARTARKLLSGLSYRVRTTWFNFTGVSPAVTGVLCCVISWSAVWSEFEVHAKLRSMIWLAHDFEWRLHNGCISSEAISPVCLHTYGLAEGSGVNSIGTGLWLPAWKFVLSCSIVRIVLKQVLY